MMIDFTNCRRVIGRAYNGANGKKIAVEYDDEVYMLKFPPSGENKITALSYTNSCISEHIASSIFNMLGIVAQNTLLGTFEVAGKIKIVCACKDFTNKTKRFFDFCSIKNTVIDSESNGSGTEPDDILEPLKSSSIFLPQNYSNTSGICLSLMHSSATSIVTTATGAFCMMTVPEA